MKKTLLTVIALTLGLFIWGSSLDSKASAASMKNTKNTTLTEEQILDRFEQIDQKYAINERLSNEDAKFIKNYAKPNIAQSTGTVTTLARKSLYFNKSGSGSGISATMNGYVWSDIGYINNSFGAYFSTLVNTGKATKIVNSVTISAYGLVGSGGFGKVYGKTLSKSNTNQNYLYSDMSDNFIASVAYSATYAKTTVYNTYGSFTIRSADN